MCISRQSAVCVSGVSKTYRFHEKQPGIINSFRSLVSRQVQTRRALRSIDLSLSEGEAVGLLGPNGSGKSTLIKCLTGVLTPDEGEIEVVGHVPQRRSADFLRSIGVVLGQKSQLIWELPPWDGFLLHARMYGLDDDFVKGRAEKLADMLKVSGNLYTPLRRLSLGQRIKCEIIAVLLHQPSVLFLDEPTIGLDVVAKRDIRHFLRQLVSQQGMTLLLSSHITTDIEEVTSRVLLLDRGNLMFDGPIDRLDLRMRLRRVEIDRQNLGSNSCKDLQKRLGCLTGVAVQMEDDALVALVEPEAMQSAAEVIFSPQLSLQVNITTPRAETILAEYFDQLDSGKKDINDTKS